MSSTYLMFYYRQEEIIHCGELKIKLGSGFSMEFYIDGEKMDVLPRNMCMTVDQEKTDE